MKEPNEQHYIIYIFMSAFEIPLKNILHFFMLSNTKLSYGLTVLLKYMNHSITIAIENKMKHTLSIFFIIIIGTNMVMLDW